MEKAKHSALDVAAWLLRENFRRVIEDEEGEEEFLTNMKLQKLLYYTQGAFLALSDKPLFHEPLVAWQHGPVVVDVYSAYKNFGSDPINTINEGSNSSDFTSDEEEIMLSVMNVFGGYTASQLRKMTHEETPWKEAICRGKGTELSLDTITDYFAENYV